jgi:hypothetical protein
MLHSQNRALARKMETMQKELKKQNSNLDVILTSELLSYLPRGRRPSNLRRNQIVHGANVTFDLAFLDSLSTKKRVLPM